MARSRSRSRSRSPPRRRSRSPRAGEETESIPLGDGETAYILGRGGQTKRRLANFSGATLEIDPKGNSSFVQITGTEKQRELARLSIKVTLMQRSNSKLIVDFAHLSQADFCACIDVPREAVGFVMGSKGATLRELESRYRTFMVCFICSRIAIWLEAEIFCFV
jgi:hypothetical protein